MSKKKLSAKNISILTLTTAGLGASISLSASYLTEVSFWTIFAWVNGCANLPLLLLSSDALRQELGLRSLVQVIGNGSSRTYARKIPINTAQGTKDIFMNTLQLGSGSSNDRQNEVAQVSAIPIWFDGNEYTLTVPELEEFVNIAWHRQTRKKNKSGKRVNGFSRTYWTKTHRPNLTILEYNLRMWALASCDGLVLDRSEGRSGRLSVPPKEAISVIRSRY